ncbi:hypothetical protein ABE021_05230 [Sporosarcina gallistercoris]|uniref:hypothetical protein n=1 Tax=Sporosarcina gallistercoris TaxID=2762245 RepID=UPI003D2D3E87
MNPGWISTEMPYIKIGQKYTLFGRRRSILQTDKKYTVAGTDIEEVKRLNANSGLTYNELNALIAKTGGKGSAQYSDTDSAQVKREILGE